MSASNDNADRPYFSFEGDLAAVPDKPTHCRQCNIELELMRRYAGLCANCIKGKAQPRAAPTAPLRCRFTLLRELSRQRVGHKERYVEVQCECGQKRTLKWSTWEHKRPLCCNQCRLKDINARGFEAEYAR